MKKALLVYGGWEGHEPKQVAEIFEGILKDNRFQTCVTDTLDAFGDEKELRELDLIVPLWTMGDISQEYVDNISRAVESGVGLAGCHGGMCDAFRNNTSWQFLTGGQWVAHPAGDGFRYTVKICEDSDLFKGIEDFEAESEQYYLHVDPANIVHAYTMFDSPEERYADTKDGAFMANGAVSMPVAWTRKWGKGKIFYNSMGHVANVFDIPQVTEMMLRGFLYVSEKEV